MGINFETYIYFRCRLTVRFRIAIILVFVLIWSSSCEEDKEIKPFYENRFSISEFLQENQDEFNLFYQLLKQGDLERTLTAYNPSGNDYTLFLPTNEAIEKFIEENDQYQDFSDLLSDTAFVHVLVRYHVINSALERNDFPFGSLSDTTLSGDLLIMGFSGNIDSLIYLVNNQAKVFQTNIIATNGYIHLIDNMLLPVFLTTYEWLQQNEAYSIFTDALDITGLGDTFKFQDEKRWNTLLVETNEAFQRSGIHSIDDLILYLSPDRTDYSVSNNDLYQFLSYHILEGKYYLNDFEGINTNYNTYASSTVSINGSGLEIKINQGFKEFEIGSEIIDYIRIDYDISNASSINGAIHSLEDMMEFYLPGQISRTFQFLEEPIILEASKDPDTYVFNQLDNFEFLIWEGIEEITYIKSSSSNGANENDYVEFEGDFSIVYELPEVLPGSYNLQIRARGGSSENATIQVFIDDKEQIGTNIDLNTGNGFQTFDVGMINFVQYEKHYIRIENLIPGMFAWDYIRLIPE